MAAETSRVSHDKNCHMQLVGGRNELKQNELSMLAVGNNACL